MNTYYAALETDRLFSLVPWRYLYSRKVSISFGAIWVRANAITFLKYIFPLIHHRGNFKSEILCFAIRFFVHYKYQRPRSSIRGRFLSFLGDPAYWRQFIGHKLLTLIMWVNVSYVSEFLAWWVLKIKGFAQKSTVFKSNCCIL